MKKSLRVVYIGLGFLLTGLGVIGVVLPVLPTTPFLLLASFFFSRGSDRFNRWFTSTNLYRNHLEEFIQNRSMTRTTKIRLLALTSSVMLLSAFLVKINVFRGFMVLAFVYLYYYFIFRIKTIHPVVEEVCLANADSL